MTKNQKKNSSNRGKSPSAFTVHMLCANSAGRCEFDGCNKYIFHDTLTTRKLNASNVAHIVAASPDGPRGDKTRSYLLSDKLENLMLLCPQHHKLIDDYPENYPEELLLEMKKKHEDSIREMCDLISIPKSERVMFFSPIKNSSITHIDNQLTAQALLPHKRPASTCGITMSIKSSFDYNTTEYWSDLDKQLVKEFERKIGNELDTDPNTIFSVFPLAPIPLIIKLGYLFMDKINVDIYQKKRVPDTWKWIETKKTNSFSVNKRVVRDGNNIALILSLTAEINPKRVTDIVDADIIYTINAERIGVDAISSIDDLSDFWHIYQSVCDEIKNIESATEVSLFPAIPVSAAFEIGHRYMPGIYPRLRVYDDNNGFSETLTIEGAD
ncbi:MAG: SAVED domain-containing protein [Ruminococcus sp.]|nr:SAVED domain-containing protein [Ruminococcus sp.]